MSQLWLLEDLEPFPDSPEPGDVFAPTTYWVDAATGIIEHQPVPVSVCSYVPATVRRSDGSGDQIEWVAELGGGFTTLLRGDHTPGRTLLHGCLMWDRYLWLDYRTSPSGHLRLLDRAGHLTQRRHLTPTLHPGWFDVRYVGPPHHAPTGDIPDEHHSRFNTLKVDFA